MLKLQGKRIYLAALEREHCRKLYEDWEYDFEHMPEPLNMGNPLDSSDEWYDEMQRLKGEHIRLGIFLNDGTVIGNGALQDIDWRNRQCSLGMDIVSLRSRGQGYGKEAAALLLDYAFGNLGLERVGANTSERNLPGQKSLEGAGFVLEGRTRHDEWVAGAYADKLNYGMLREEWEKLCAK